MPHHLPSDKLRSYSLPRAEGMGYEGMGYSVRRYWVDEFYRQHLPKLPAGSRVLDLGGNKIRKRGQLNIECYDLRVVYANLSPAKHPDVQADATQIPFQDGIFDAVICAELLEHVRSPVTVLHETFRVLKPGGKLLVTVPFLYRVHGDPYDYGRYTDQFWLAVLQETGFQQIVIEQQGLFFSVLADFFKQYASEVSFRKPFGPVARWLIAGFQRWALKREQDARVKENSFVRSFTTGFGIVAVKT